MPTSTKSDTQLVFSKCLLNVKKNSHRILSLCVLTEIQMDPSNLGKIQGRFFLVGNYYQVKQKLRESVQHLERSLWFRLVLV